MSGVKRYTAYDALMQVESNGKFVLASDYDRDTQALKAEIERYIQDGIKLADQRDALRAQVGVMRELFLQVKQFDIEQRTGGAFNLSGLLKRIDAALQAEQ